jgi:hypothetical protein
MDPSDAGRISGAERCRATCVPSVFPGALRFSAAGNGPQQRQSSGDYLMAGLVALQVIFSWSVGHST